jgi:hypothetical protein
VGVHVFVGPYIEVLVPAGDINSFFHSEVPEAEVEGLFNTAGLKWNLGRGDPRTIEVQGRRLWQYCGVPVEERPGAPRRGMYSALADPRTGEGVVTEWDRADPAAEVGWFRAAFGAELRLLARVLGEPPVVRWGLVWWVR